MSKPAHTNGHAVTNGHATKHQTSHVEEEETTMKATHARHVSDEENGSKGDTTMKATHTSHATQEDTTMNAHGTSEVRHEAVNEGATTMEPTKETKPVTKSPGSAQSKAKPALITAPVTRPEGPSEAQIQEALAQLDTISAVLGPLAVPLSIEQRRQELKMKPGGDRLVADVLGCAARYHLVIPGVSQADAVADITLATNLQPLLARLQLVASLVSDVILQARGRAWQSTTTAYTMLLRLVTRYPALQQELQPMAALLATQHKAAPTSLRKKAAKQLAKTRKAKKAKVAAAAQAEGTPDAAPPAVTPTGPSAAGATPKPASA